ncbi:hypothetical protein [Haloarchaeobius sp. TZWSO28]|uniref:hypothetical protein n=1 Tax=unclassified Haloarchaeobius TaxID=2614452 RepID=UPI003EB8E86C
MKPDSVTATKSAFVDELEDLIREFEETGLDLEGGYTLRDDTEQDLEVQIIEIADRNDGE